MNNALDQLISDRHHLENTSDSDVFSKTKEFQKIVGSVREMGMYPYFQALECNLGSEAIIKGKKVIMLGSNNYLGLTTDPRVREAAIDAIRKYGTSATGSRLLNGTLEIHETFEREIADFLGKEAALVFTTGYQVNIGIISALANENTSAFLDKLNHASLQDAVKMAGCNTHYFKHNNPEDLERLLQAAPKHQAKLIAIDGVFSMEGDITPLPKMLALAKKHNARLLIDDAHGLGILGKRGEGTAGHFGLSKEVDLIMATFSKSLASTGGCVAGDFEVIDYIKHFGRSMIFSASITPANLAAASESLKILRAEPERVLQAAKNAQSIVQGLSAMGWKVGNTETPIVPVHIGNDLYTMLLWKELLEEGVYVNPILYPAVGKDKAMLRVSTMSTHTKDHLSFALDKFHKVGKKLELI
ncbi:MAG: aminotransferase class I/II-fold pyridoxal phosphate-dependent enzyme [Deltaproteobacteria bacterium]|nr:aminotransferase class I/II-fold pyridoxal phosphate-dependent enzyme [Deltaproteobacteria bacterium]